VLNALGTKTLEAPHTLPAVESEMYACLNSSQKKPSTVLEGNVGGHPRRRSCSLAILLNKHSTCTS
jgi:hypothetical protein